jgi:hypothetical protein
MLGTAPLTRLRTCSAHGALQCVLELPGMVPDRARLRDWPCGAGVLA